jgi:hypothetical protein
MVQEDLAVLQKKQLDLVERNKRALAAVAVYSSPSRVGELAEDNSDLRKAEAGDIILLQKGEQ